MTAAAQPERPASPPGRWPPPRVLAVLAVAYWAYIVNGIVNSELGPSLLSMSHAFRVDLSTAGILLAAQFAGYLVGAAVSGLAADRWGYRRVLFPSALGLAAGTAGTALAGTWPLAVALTAVAGVGFAMLDSLGNAIVAAQAPREGGAALNLLHTFFGLGGLTGPLLVGAFLGTAAGWRGALLLSGALALGCAVLVGLVPIPPPAHLAPPGDRPAPRHVPAGGTPWRGLHLWLLAGLLFLFVGMEQVGGGWTASFLDRTLGAPLDLAARSTAIYWGAVTVGRLLASGAALRLSSERLLGGSIALVFVAFLALGAAPGVGPALAFLAVAGLGLAPIYPTVVAITAQAYRRRFATLAGLLVSAGGLGGIVFPWLGGVIGQSWGLRATIWLGAAIALVMLMLFSVLRRTPHR